MIDTLPMQALLGPVRGVARRRLCCARSHPPGALRHRRPRSRGRRSRPRLLIRFDGIPTPVDLDAAATFATQPLPAGPRTAVVTLAGGCGVLAADAMEHTGLELVELPEDLLKEIDERLSPRWSRQNPIDLAGGETRDTVPEVLELYAQHPDIDAIVFIGFGIQSTAAGMIRRRSPCFPEHWLGRIVAYSERQDGRYGAAAAELLARYGKPILRVTELAVADPTNRAPPSARESGRPCYPSVDRAITALDHLWTYARRRARA